MKGKGVGRYGGISTGTSCLDLSNVFFCRRCLVLWLFEMRFMTLGSRINRKYSNSKSVLLIEQVSHTLLSSYSSAKLLFILRRTGPSKTARVALLEGWPIL